LSCLITLGDHFLYRPSFVTQKAGRAVTARSPNLPAGNLGS
jgi:hypothetical protein